MRRATVTLLTMVLIVGLTLDALAKGPGSATLTGPGIKEPIQLIHPSISFSTYQDDAPVRLIQLTGLWYGNASPAITPPADLGTAYTLTWANPGPSSDQIEAQTIHQHIYLDAAGGPVIHTPSQVGLKGWGPEVIGWFEAPPELESTIHEVIDWSSTEEAAEIQARFTPLSNTPDAAVAHQPGDDSPPTHSAAPTLENRLSRVLLPLAIAAGVGSLMVWRVRHAPPR